MTRQELYDLIWAEPMRTAARRFGKSDVALAKACRRANIPVPERGYWARLRAGKEPECISLPERGFGQSDLVRFGEQRTESDQGAQPLPPPPTFAGDHSRLRERARELVGHASAPKSLANCHEQIAKLLAQDDERRKRQETATYPSFFDNPIFESPLERRRLKLLCGLFQALARAGCPASIRGREGRDVTIAVGNQFIPLTLEIVKPARLRRKPSGSLTIQLHYPNPEITTVWSDDAAPLETSIKDIAVEVLVAGEIRHRAHCRQAYQWRVEEIKRLAEEERRRIEEHEEKVAAEAARVVHARVMRLHRDARNLKRANEIREYIQAVQNSNASANGNAKALEIDAWAAWAESQAADLDPLLNYRFLQ